MSARIFSIAICCFIAASLSADQVLMQNGDRYNGKILSVSTNAVVLQSDVLGSVTFSRDKVASMGFGSVVATNPTPPKPQPIILSGVRASSTNAAIVAAQLHQLGAQTNLVQQVQSQFLTAASPEANAKFNQMLTDLTTGKMTMADLRTQAKDAADQLRALEKESGDDDTGTMDMYLSILDNFLNETTPATASTNAVDKATK